MSLKNDKNGSPKATPPSADPAETIERVLSRKQLRIETGDVVLTRVRRGSPSVGKASEIYELRVVGSSDRRAERFATFGHAAARGEEIARTRKTRLMYVEAEGNPPFLLEDATGQQ